MHGGDPSILTFIDLTLSGTIFLFILGFVGGLVSGFIGSGGAFVLTPGMMSMGVPGPVAVASNMCHKFPKALVGALKRFRYGQVDVKLGLIMGLSAEGGVQVGIMLQQWILERFGQAGSDLYVSVSFVVVLLVVGLIVYRDAIKMKKAGGVEKTTKLAQWIQSIELWPMISFPTSGIRVSFWFTVPLGFATGMLAATIAVGGFIGVPCMIYVLGMSGMMASATELVVAFVMGLGGSAIWAYHGMVDIRLALIILAGSLFGIQLGAIGTTYVKDYMVKYVMAVIMLIVAVSRATAMPKYLSKLGLIDMGQQSISLLTEFSYWSMCFALAVGAYIILKAMIEGLMREKAELRAAALEHA